METIQKKTACIEYTRWRPLQGAEVVPDLSRAGLRAASGAGHTFVPRVAALARHALPYSSALLGPECLRGMPDLEAMQRLGGHRARRGPPDVLRSSRQVLHHLPSRPSVEHGDFPALGDRRHPCVDPAVPRDTEALHPLEGKVALLPEGRGERRLPRQ